MALPTRTSQAIAIPDHLLFRAATRHVRGPVLWPVMLAYRRFPVSVIQPRRHISRRSGHSHYFSLS
jgi:hypothetical protein